LLQTLKDFENGVAQLPGLDPQAYRVRPGRFTVSKGRTLEQVVDDFVRLEQQTGAR
jgi:hypothetical protein